MCYMLQCATREGSEEEELLISGIHNLSVKQEKLYWEKMEVNTSSGQQGKESDSVRPAEGSYRVPERMEVSEDESSNAPASPGILSYILSYISTSPPPGMIVSKILFISCLVISTSDLPSVSKYPTYTMRMFSKLNCSLINLYSGLSWSNSINNLLSRSTIFISPIAGYGNICYSYSSLLIL